MDDEAIRQLDESVKAEVQDAWDFAEQSPDPEPGELWTDVYAADAGRPAANAEQ